MCSLTVGLMAASTGLQMYQQNQQNKAQQAAYDAQIKAATFNKAAEEHKAEKTAENYAQKQHQLNDKYKLAVANARAQFGSSGLDSSGGSLSDVLDASADAYSRDSVNLLSSQREDEWASYTKQVQYQNEINAYNTMKQNAKKNGRLAMWGTALQGAASIYGQGYKENLWGGSNAATSTGNYNFLADYNKNNKYGFTL